MEWWILTGVIVALLGVAVVVRLRKTRGANAQKETKNIYPLW
jgi:hypothetical protein